MRHPLWRANTLGAAPYVVADSMTFTVTIRFISAAVSCLAVGLSRYWAECTWLNLPLRRSVWFLHTSMYSISVSHSLEFFEKFLEGQSVVLALVGKLNFVTPILIELLFVLLIEGFVLCELCQAVGGRLVVISTYWAVTATCICDGGVRATLVFNVNYFDWHICDFTYLLVFWKVCIKSPKLTLWSKRGGPDKRSWCLSQSCMHEAHLRYCKEKPLPELLLRWILKLRSRKLP